MDIMLMVILIIVAVAAVAVTVTVVVRRRGEKVQNKLYLNNQQDQTAKPDEPIVDAKQVERYLSLHESDHNDFMQLFATRRGEFDSFIETGRGAPSLLLEHLHQLDEHIEMQINEDDDWMRHFSPQERQQVAGHHRQWRTYQANVEYMIRQLS